jgi:uncharacterized membrane protein
MAKLAKRLNRIAPWRFLLFVAILIIVGLASWRFRDASQALLIGFDAAAILFLLSYVPAFGRESTEMRRLSAESDAGRTMLLVVTFVLSAVVLVAIVAELGLRGSLGLTDKLLIVLSCCSPGCSGMRSTRSITRISIIRPVWTGRTAADWRFPGRRSH